MAFSCHPLLILTWKHLKERRRRFWHTIWEITSGVLVFVILLLMRQVIKHSFFIEGIHSDDQYLDDIVFTPNNSETHHFMLQVTPKLSRRYGSAAAGPYHFRGFDSPAAIQNYIKSLNNSHPVAVVNFKNMNKSMPKLDYSIYLVNAHATYKLHRPKLKRIHIREPFESQQHASQPLMKLQWAIDRTFMESVSGGAIPHSISLPQFRENSAASSKTSMAIIHQFLIFCTVAAPLPFFLYNSSRLVNERRSGLKELMKIVGVSPNVLRLSHLMDAALLSIVYAGLITLMLKVTSTPILPESNPVIIALTIVLHFLNITSLTFVTSALSQSYEHANGLALVVYLVSCVLCSIWHHHYENTVQVYVVCWFLPHAPVHMFWDEVKYLESIGEGTTFSNIAAQHGPTCVPILVSWTAFVVQLIFIMFLAWYLDLVKPGTYGVPQKWNFPFKKQFWARKKKVTFHVTVEQTTRVLRDDRFFQKTPMGAPIVIKVTEVTKIYSKGYSEHKVAALDNVNLEVYKGEITVVLGVHGAGKTTLLSVVTGMTSATSGKVYVNGFDNTTRIRDIRKTLGLCLQQNLTFDYLTVRENIFFFESLRGPRREARTCAENLIAKLNLQDQANYYSHQLSTSKERCLQVACALAGGADVLILDEPTSNCDATTRHNLWDVILVLRGHKTILMTTTSIEEANALGDRVALLSRGKLKCFGTPMFLKDAIGTGFNLSVTLKHKDDMFLVRAVVDQTLPEAVALTVDHKRVIFTLPAKDHELLPKLFDTLEEKKAELGITAMGVGMSMEEIFLEFIDEGDYDDAIFVSALHDVKKVKGWRLCVQQMRVLMKRNFSHIWSVKCQFIILQIMVPVLGLIVITVTTNSQPSLNVLRPPGTDVHVRPHTMVLMDLGPVRSDLPYLRQLEPGLEIVRSRGVSKDFMNLTYSHSDKLVRNVIGIKMYDDHSNIYIPTTSQSVASKAINIFSNLYMSVHMPKSSEPISLSSSNTTRMDLFIPKATILCLFWTMWVTFFITLPLTPFIGTLIQEYTSGVRYTHFVVGCPYFLHWLAKMVTHSIIFLTIIPPSVLLCAKFLDFEETLTQNDFLVAIFIAQMLFFPAFLLQLYVLSFFLGKHDAVSLIYIQSIALGFLAPFIQILLLDLSEVSKWYAYPMQFLTALGRLCPVFTLSALIAKFTSTARMRTYCSHNGHFCKFLMPTDYNSKMLDMVCCDEKREKYEYFNESSYIEMATLVFNIILYAIILTAVQKRWIQNCVARLFNSNYAEKPNDYKDLNVYHEFVTVRRMMTCYRPSDKVLLVDNLNKKYTGCRKSRRVTAVQGISFCVSAGESLALLGQNGSGKTSTLLMIAGSTSVTKGDCFAHGKFLKKNRSKYIEKVSLTKATGGLDEFYTGYKNIELLCLLHGYSRNRAKAFAMNCLGYMGLQPLMHVPVHAYSEVSARRLGLCAALIAAPRVVLLDEPMRSLDPHARPLVRRALASLVRGGSALLIAEHSLDWRDLDSLCTRVAVLFNGQLVALGPTDYVRQMLADGHTACLKLKLEPIRTYIYEESVGLLSDITNEDKRNNKRDENKPSALSMLRHVNETDDESEKANKKVFNSSNPLTTGSAQEDNEDNVPVGSSRLEKAQVDSVLRAHRSRSRLIRTQASTSRRVESTEDNGEAQTSDKEDKTQEKTDDRAKESSLDGNDTSSRSDSNSEYNNDALSKGGQKVSVLNLKNDFKRLFPTSELADEHLSMLYFHIRGDNPMPYSLMFSKLELLKELYQDILEDYTLSEISIDNVYCLLANETV